MKHNMKTPLEIARIREHNIASGLLIIATKHGVNLRGPLHINSLGEFSLIADGPETPYCGMFGTFADILNDHNPRTGLQSGAHIMPENGWCYLNHFDAERLVASNLNK